MRIVGAVLLIAGFLLCLTIVWAAVGFLAMSLGLLCLLIAERKQQTTQRALHDNPIENPATSASTLDTPVVSVAAPSEMPEVPPRLPEPGGSAVQIPPRGSTGEGAPRRVAARKVTAEMRPGDFKDRRRLADRQAGDSLSDVPPKQRSPLAAAGSGRVSRDDSRSRPDVSPTQATRAGRPSNETAGTPARFAEDKPKADSGSSVRVKSVLERPAPDIEDVRNLSELLNKIANPTRNADHG